MGSTSANTEQGKRYRDNLKNEGLGLLPELPAGFSATAAINELKDKLKTPLYSEIHREYKRLNRIGKKYPEWYSLYEGPRNLRALAEYLNKGATYEIFYRSSSNQSHVTDIHHLTFPMPDGPNILAHLRNPLGLVDTATNALAILVETIQLMIKKFRSGEMTNFQRWYEKEILPKHLQLSRASIGQLKWYEETFLDKK